MSKIKSSEVPKTRLETKSLHEIDLVGRISHQITGAKLPSIRQALQVLFYNTRVGGLSVKESAKVTCDTIVIFWAQARIPTKDIYKCRNKLNGLYSALHNIQKTVPEKRSQKQKQVAQDFVDSLDNLFDIAHINVLKMITNENDRQFLLKQREKGRAGCMAGVDMKLYQRETRTEKRLQREQERKRKYNEAFSSQFGVAEPDLNNDMDFQSSNGSENDEQQIGEMTSLSISLKRDAKQIFTPRLLSALDNAKVTSGKAMHIITAVADALGYPAEGLVINPTTLHKLRNENRKKGAEDMIDFTDKVI